MMKLCDYGCGQEAKYELKFKTTVKNCCSKHYSSCPSNKKCWNKGLTKETDFHVKKYSMTKIGIKPWNKGLSKKNSKKVLEISMLISDALKTNSLSNDRRRTIRIKSSVKRCNLFVGFKDKKRSNESIKKLKKSKIGTKYDKISSILKNHPLFCKIEKPEVNENKDIVVRCKKCKKKFIPSISKLYSRIYDLESGSGGSYLYCSDECKFSCNLFNLRTDYFLLEPNKEQLYTASEYQTFRQQVLEREEYKCEYCNNEATHVHHSRPQKLEPFFSLDPDFGIACCESCHYKYGHKHECSTGNLASTICNN